MTPWKDESARSRVYATTLIVMMCAVGAACRDVVRVPTPSAPLLDTEEGCQLNPQCGGGADGTVTESPGGLSDLPPDPSPGAPGIWIGWEARDCYLNYAEGLGADIDQDWIEDNCDYQLARAFAPTLSISAAESCPGGEPYWAVRYFDDAWRYGWGEFVRIAYMPAYYQDCGSSYAHDGDAEFIMLQLGFNGATRHWELVRGWLSAHSNTNPVNVNNNSDWPWYYELEYPSGVYRSYPRVYVSHLKHANYLSRDRCNTAGPINYDDCTFNVDWGRIRVWRSHNIGGYNYFRTNCTPSQNAAYYQNGISECFWSGRSNFWGWRANSGDGGSLHALFLMSGAYECWLYDGFNCYYGPSQNRPPPLVTTVSVSPGTSNMAPGQTKTLTATPRDQFGYAMGGRTATWSTSNPSIATVSSTGALTASVTGVNEGHATVTARVSGVNGTTTANVVIGWSDLSVSVSGPSTMGPNDVCWFGATASQGTPPYTYSWQSGAQVETTDGSSYFNASAPITVTVDVTDADGSQTSGSAYADVDENNPGCH